MSVKNYTTYMYHCKLYFNTIHRFILTRINNHFMTVGPVRLLAPYIYVVQLEEVLDRESRGPGLNPAVVRHYFSDPVTVGAVTTPGTDRLPRSCQGK